MLIPWNRVHYRFGDDQSSLFSFGPSSFVAPRLKGHPPAPRQVRWRDEGDVASLEFEVPGFCESELEIVLDGNLLTVHGVRKEAIPQGYSLYRKERAETRLRECVTLPPDVLRDTLTAELPHGLLTLCLEKKAPEVARKITISTPQSAAPNV
jgi:HSP20 family molecular chaperone IbpA